jgi:hypothetical protein
MASWPALGPITATLPTADGSNGSKPSLTSRTVPSAATRRATARRPGSSTPLVGTVVPPRIPTRPISRRTWRTWPSTTDSSTCPGARRRPGGTEPGRRARHLEVEPRQRRRHGGVRPEPVGHDQPVEAPLAPQHAADQVRLLAAVDTVDLVVGGHHGPDAGLPYGVFEGDEVDLPQGPLVDLGADRHPLVLLVVAGEVLHAAGDPARLHALDVGAGDAGRQQRVLGEGLEGPPGERRAHNAHRRTEQHVHVLGAGLGGQHVAELADEVGVPGRPDGGAAGDRQRAPADQAVAPDARRAVGHLERRDAQALDGRQVPHVGAGGQGRLLVEGHGADEALDLAAGIVRCHSSSPLFVKSSPRVDEGAATAGPRACSVPTRPGAAASRACTKRRLVTAGSITSSISKCSATWTAFPCS